MVTANLPAFGTQGTRIDVTVSALGDAKSLQGGTLLVTPLLGADGNVYAVAQGSLAIAGFQAEGEAAKITRGVPTVGRISNGAIIEREIEFALNRLNQVRLALRNADLHHRQAHRRRDQRLHRRGRPPSRSIPSTVQLTLPPQVPRQHGRAADRDRAVADRARSAAKVVIDERSGVIVMGRDVRVSTVAVAQGNLTVTDRRNAAGQPARAVLARPTPWSCRAPASACRRTARSSRVVKEGVSLQQLVDGLNALGIGPRDMIAILQAIKAAGAIQADIEVM